MSPPLCQPERGDRESLPLSPAVRVALEQGREPAVIPAARLAAREAGSGNSWRSRTWSNTHCHRAGPAGSSHSWPAPAGRSTPCWGPSAE